MNNKKSQISFEYVIVMGFITAVIIGILSVAFFYSNNIKDRVEDSQLGSCANKIVSTAESVYYAGKPSKATILCYLPDNIKQVDLIDNSIVITFFTSTGTSKISFTSNVPLKDKTGVFTSGGTKKILIEAEDAGVEITNA